MRTKYYSGQNSCTKLNGKETGNISQGPHAPATEQKAWHLNIRKGTGHERTRCILLSAHRTQFTPCHLRQSERPQHQKGGVAMATTSSVSGRTLNPCLRGEEPLQCLQPQSPRVRDRELLGGLPLVVCPWWFVWFLFEYHFHPLSLFDSNEIPINLT